MSAACRMGDADNRAGGLVHDELRLQRVALFSCPNSGGAAFFGALHGRFRRVDEDDLILSVAGEKGFLARKCERSAPDEHVFAPANIAIGRALIDSATVPNMQICAIFGSVLQRHHELCGDGQMIAAPPPRALRWASAVCRTDAISTNVRFLNPHELLGRAPPASLQTPGSPCRSSPCWEDHGIIFLRYSENPESGVMQEVY